MVVIWNGSKNGFLSPGCLSLPCAPCVSSGTKGTPESTHPLKPLSTPFLGLLLPELCRAVSPGQCSFLSFTSILIPFILKSQDRSREQMDCWWLPQGHHGGGKAVIGNPLAQFLLHCDQDEEWDMRLPFALWTASQPNTASEFKSWLSFGFPPFNQKSCGLFFIDLYILLSF